MKKEFKVGQEVFSITEGFTKILKINNNVSDPVLICDRSFSKDGRYLATDEHPTLFHSSRDAAEYFSNIKVKKKTTVWVSLLSTGETISYHSKEKAEDMAGSDRVSLKEVTFEWEE